MKECPVCKTSNEDQNQKCSSCNFQFAADPVNSSVFSTDVNQEENYQSESQTKYKGHGIKARYVIIPVVLIIVLVMIISIAGYIQKAKDAQVRITVHNSKLETVIASSDMTDPSAA